MCEVEQGRVIKVTYADVGAFLRHGPTETRIQGEHNGEWLVPSAAELDMMGRLLEMVSREEASSYSWRVAPGTRMGLDTSGVFLHESHMKRYFGILERSADALLLHRCPPAVPRWTEGMAMTSTMSEQERRTSVLLAKVVHGVHELTDFARQQVLYSTFKGADCNGNGFLSRVEMATMIRRVLPSTTHDQVMLMMAEVDSNKDNKVDYAEFIEYLTRSEGSKLAGGLRKALLTPADCVRAAFRVWTRTVTASSRKGS